MKTSKDASARRRSRQGGGQLALALLLTLGCSAEGEAGPESVLAETPGQTSTDSARVPGDFSATYGILRDSAALVEGTVAGITTSYDEKTGPRTLIEFQTERVHAGNAPTGRLVFPLFGGPVPGKGYAFTSASIWLVKGARYFLFLGNREWFYSPFRGEALRVDSVNGREMLLDAGERPLLSVTPQGFHFGNSKLFDVVPAPTVDAITTAPRENIESSATAHALDRARFVALIHEAIAAEGSGPSGTFVAQPSPRDSWRVVGTTPEIGAPYTPGAATPGVLSPETSQETEHPAETEAAPVLGTERE